MALTRLLAAAAAAGLAAAQTSYVPATSRLHAGQRQCQTLGRCGGVNPASSMIDPTIKLFLVSSPKAGATLVERLMLAALNLTGEAVRYRDGWHYPLPYSHGPFQRAKGRMPPAGNMASESCAQGTGWLCVDVRRRRRRRDAILQFGRGAGDAPGHGVRAGRDSAI